MKEVENFYDDFAKAQNITGINKRHYSIKNWCLKFGLKPNSKVLEIGCGIGTFTELIANYCVDGIIDGYDISGENIKVAKERLSKYSNVNLKKGDVTEEQFKDQYDFIILPDVLEHIPIELHGKLFESLNKVLSSEGKIIVHIPNPGYLEWCHINTPENLQIIDQPLYTNLLTNNIFDNGLYIHYLNTYSIWIDQCDYQVLVLKKLIKREYKLVIPEKLSLLKRILIKLKINR